VLTTVRIQAKFSPGGVSKRVKQIVAHRLHFGTSHALCLCMDDKINLKELMSSPKYYYYYYYYYYYCTVPLIVGLVQSV
jgi:hypothetical protein